MERYLIPLLSEANILNEVEKDPLNVVFLDNPSNEFVLECVKREPKIIAYLKDKYLTKELFDYAVSLDSESLVKCTKKRLKDFASYEQIEILLKSHGNKLKDISKELITPKLCKISFPTITDYKIVLDYFSEEAYSSEVVDFIFEHLYDLSFGISAIPHRFLNKTRLLKAIGNIESLTEEQKKHVYFFDLDEFPAKCFTPEICERLLNIKIESFGFFPEEIKMAYAEKILPIYPLAIRSLVFPRTSDKKIDEYLRINPSSIAYLDFKKTKERYLYACELDSACFKYLPKEFNDLELTRKYCKLNFFNLAYAPKEYIDEAFVFECFSGYLNNLKAPIDKELAAKIKSVLKKLDDNKVIDIRSDVLHSLERKHGLRIPLNSFLDSSVNQYFVNEIAYGMPETNHISLNEIEICNIKLIETKNENVGDVSLSKLSLQAEFVLHEIEEVKLSERNIRDSRFFYLSDIHLDYKIESMFLPEQEEAIYNFIVSLADKVAEKCKLRWTDWLFIAGDIGSVYEYNEIFLRELSKKLKYDGFVHQVHYCNIAIVLGNHELWDFDKFVDQSQNSNADIDTVIEKYRKLCEELKIYLLENDLLVIKNTDAYPIPNAFFDKIDISHFEKYRRDIVAVVYGGIGFSGQAKLYNAGNSSIYRGVITYEEDVKRSKSFEDGLNKIKPLLANKPLFILSHNPIDNWCSGDFLKGVTYINGHNHHNDYRVEDDYRIYADAQVGYKSLNVVPKYFSFEYKWDFFGEYKDGIYEITPIEYEKFCRGYALPGTYNYKNTKLFMLKNSGYYMFISQSETSKNLCILNGGQRKSLSKKDINYYFDNLVVFAEAIKNDPIINLIQNRIKQVSQFVKAIGGEGRVHGTIVDIDFLNHIYVNIKDGTLTPYYALSMVDKWTYPTLELLLEERVPDLLPNYRKLLTEQSKEFAVALRNDCSVADSTYVGDTSIYQDSRIMLKLQALLESNIVKIWEDSILEDATKKLEQSKKLKSIK